MPTPPLGWTNSRKRSVAADAPEEDTRVDTKVAKTAEAVVLQVQPQAAYISNICKCILIIPSPAPCQVHQCPQSVKLSKGNRIFTGFPDDSCTL
ncbi:Rho Gtpase-Activating Protein 4 [Manis pentadactyla]|nr:Rho Gtpase-Activating Protein 4 [Manis pentadactyla]